MDKKNTMLLTVIAVATLLVAVVGATFAYFNIQNDVTGSTTAVTGTVASAGFVTGKIGEDNVYINLSNTDMRAENYGKFYAVADGKYSKDIVVNHEVFTATLAGAAAGETYTCEFDLAFTVTGNDKLDAGDAVLNITGTGVEALDKAHDLSSDISDLNQKVTWTWTADGAKTITMNAYIENKQGTIQNDTLGSTNLGVTVKVEGLTCDVAE